MVFLTLDRERVYCCVQRTTLRTRGATRGVITEGAAVSSPRECFGVRIILLLSFFATSSTNSFTFTRILGMSKFLTLSCHFLLKTSLRVGNVRSCFFFSGIQYWFFSEYSVLWLLIRTDCNVWIFFWQLIPCGWSSFLISSSSIVSSSSHLMTNFEEFRVLCGETFTGK